MSILIRGMEMPENCFECPCMRHDSIDGIRAYQCNITMILHDGIQGGDGRPEWCPLEERPDDDMR